MIALSQRCRQSGQSYASLVISRVQPSLDNCDVCAKGPSVLFLASPCQQGMLSSCTDAECFSGQLVELKVLRQEGLLFCPGILLYGQSPSARDVWVRCGAGPENMQTSPFASLPANLEVPPNLPHA